MVEVSATFVVVGTGNKRKEVAGRDNLNAGERCIGILHLEESRIEVQVELSGIDAVGILD